MPADQGYHMFDHNVYRGTTVPEWSKWLFWTMVIIAIIMW